MLTSTSISSQYGKLIYCFSLSVTISFLGNSCANYFKSKFLNENHSQYFSSKKKISNSIVGNPNTVNDENNQINGKYDLWKCTEILLEPLFQFVILSDRFLIPLLLPPSPFNSSLSHTLRYTHPFISPLHYSIVFDFMKSASY